MMFKTSFKALLQGGPVGMFHAMREAYISHRIHRVAILMDQERELHREHIELLRRQMNRLLLRHAHVTQRAASFWRAL